MDEVADQAGSHPVPGVHLPQTRLTAPPGESGPIEPVRAVNVCGQIAGALDAAHAQGVVHRDIKPENIVLAAGDFAYLLDFGIAEQTGDTRLTKTGMTVGSMAYIAPERLTGAATTASVDVYGLACVLFEALTGRRPFVAGAMAKVMTEHLYAPPPAPSAVNPRVPAGFDDVIARGMAKEPDDRFGSAGALARAAQRALSEAGPVAAASSYPTAAAPHVQARTDIHTHPGPPLWSGPGSGPVRVVPVAPAGPSGGGPGWVVPAAIVLAVVLLGAIGIIVGLLVGQSSGSDATAAMTPPQPQLTPSPRLEPTFTTTSRVPVPPPGVRGPDSLGALFVMRCVGLGSQDWITCEGGNNARVFIY